MPPVAVELLVVLACEHVVSGITIRQQVAGM